MMTNGLIETDILVAGGGIAGLTAAARLGADGWRVVVVDPAPADVKTGDLRTTAFLQPAIATLERAGAWTAMRGHGARLETMRIIDAGGVERAVRERADFDAAPAGHDHFGWNIPNRAAREALIDCISRSDAVEFMPGTTVTGFLGRLDGALVRLSDDRRVSARLVVAADGRNSTLRDLANLPVRRWDYGQHALVFCVLHDRPHEAISTEIHRTGGPLTLVPMPDEDGTPRSSVVWMTPSERSAELDAMDDARLSCEITAETMGVMGALTVTGPRARWPIVSQIATRLIARRLALVAEAAHVMPPIGAQGLNTSLHDIETLARTVEGAPDPGEETLLARWERAALPHAWTRVLGVDLLNRAARAEAQPLRDLRRLGLAAISRIGPLRELAVRAGIGR